MATTPGQSAILSGSGYSPWQAPLAALFSGISAAGQPGGWSNFGAGVTQGQQNFQRGQAEQQMMQLRQQQIAQAEEEQRRANQEEAQRQAKLDLIKQTLAGSAGSPTNTPVNQVGNYGAATGGIQTASGAPGQSAILGGMDPQQSALFSTYAQIDPEGAFQMLAERSFAEPKDTSTDDMREYQMAVQQGYPGTFFDYQNDLKKAGAGNNSTTIYNKDYGSIPPGHRLVESPDGVRLEALPVDALPGSPAATEAAAAAATAEQQQANKVQSADIVTQDIGRVIEKVEASPTATTGFIGNLMKSIGGTEAGNVRALLDTVEANTAFDRLQEMRNASKTGGALGSITERELALLAATKGNLQQSQDGQQLVYNLKRLNNVILDIVHGEGQGPKRYDLGGAAANDLKSKYGLE